MNLLLIDNYDSFTYNLDHLFAGLDGVEVTVKRNDDPYLEDLRENRYDAVVIGPGPGSPTDPNYFGNCQKVILEYGTQGLPVLGVCLGFQGIASAFGASIKKAALPMHGKMSELEIIKQENLFANVPNHTSVMRYHSLMVDMTETFPDELLVTAEVREIENSVQVNGQEVMAIEHRQFPIYGVQFHPESFATESGAQMAKNFLFSCRSKVNV